MGLHIKSLNKKYGEVSLYRNFSISFQEGSITCILGPSGCGKTTLLNMIGNIIPPDGGTFEGFDGKVLSYIFQEPRLLPWKTVRENIEFVLEALPNAQERSKIASEFIGLVELDNFANFYPAKLSGGMRQRVSIARAFAYQSNIILMDEPLKGLDLKLKLNLIKTFNRLWQADRRTVIFVTHDVEEALLLGNEIVVLSQAPVQIVTRVRVDEPVEQRTLNSSTIMGLKQQLFAALGKE